MRIMGPTPEHEQKWNARVAGEHNLLTFSRQVFGIDPDDLEAF